ncbi:MAG TPA: family 16 glycoside hydrolase [Acidimicrobiales bacterium]|nr:family 16 glycoside hydrolase [Acidimicrobiales bacterium]
MSWFGRRKKIAAGGILLVLLCTAYAGLAGAAPRQSSKTTPGKSKTVTQPAPEEPAGTTTTVLDGGSADATPAPTDESTTDTDSSVGDATTGPSTSSSTSSSSTTVSPTSTTTAPATSTTLAPAPSTTEVPTTTDAPAPAPTSDVVDTAFVETFAGLPPLWSDGATVGRWLVQYTGYGRVGAATVDGVPALVTRPKASTSPGETHAAMVTTLERFGDIDLTVRTKTSRQLRTGSAPNPWEVGWVVWAHERDERFYYFILKPNGWELGKADDTRIDPAGPQCTWPEYRNCKYPGAQRFLATGSSPTFPVGAWHDLRVRQVGSTITVWGNGRQLTSFTDTVNPYLSGAVGLYNEDAEAAFASLRIERL